MNYNTRPRRAAEPHQLAKAAARDHVAAAIASVLKTHGPQRCLVLMQILNDCLGMGVSYGAVDYTLKRRPQFRRCQSDRMRWELA